MFRRPLSFRSCPTTKLFAPLSRTTSCSVVLGACATRPSKRENSQILTPDKEMTLQRELKILGKLRKCLNELEADDADIRVLDTATQQLHELFLVVIVGEYNAGKSSLLNALLGKKYLAEGITPTTKAITVIGYGEEFAVQEDRAEGVTIQIPNSILHNLRFVDTPGTNAIIKTHQKMTEDFLPRSDLIVFVSSVDRAFSESERQLLELIKQWKKKVVFVLSKIDFLEAEAHIQELTKFVEDGMHQLIDMKPVIFSVSSKLALRAKELMSTHDQGSNNTGRAMWARSGFHEFENYIFQHLDVKERLHLKLGNPLGIAEQFILRYGNTCVQRLSSLQKDLSVLQNIAEQIAEFEKDMMKDLEYQTSRVDNVLLQMCYRADNFFEDHLRLSNFRSLLQSDVLKTAFERQVIGQTDASLMNCVSDLAEWTTQRQIAHWHRTVNYARLQADKHAEKGMIGHVRLLAEENQKDFLQSIIEDVHKMLQAYDREKESAQFSEEVSTAWRQTAAVEIGAALSLGAVLTLTMLDVTGLLGVSALAATGLCIIPYRRSQLKKAFHEKIGSLRQDLKATLSRHASNAISHHSAMLKEAISPYSEFIQKEREKTQRLDAQLTMCKKEIQEIGWEWKKQFQV